MGQSPWRPGLGNSDAPICRGRQRKLLRGYAVPSVYIINNEDQLIDLAEKMRSLMVRVRPINVAFSSSELKCQDYANTPKSLPQNALAHVWMTEACAYHYGKSPKSVTQSDLQGMTRWMKLKCYVDVKQDWLVEYIRNPETRVMKLDATSMANWNMGQTHFFMEWVLQFWAEKGLVLEVKGQFQELAEKQNK